MTDRELLQQALDALQLTGIEYLTSEEIDRLGAFEVALRARLAQPEPEPVAVWELQEGGWDTIADADWMETLPVGTKLYTAPPQREWQGLTHEEKKAIYQEATNEDWTDLDVINATEAKLKEKNK